jgi:membrane protein DedA with SNARE-associated domain
VVRRGRSGGRRSALASRLAAALEAYGLLRVFAARFLPVVRGLTGPSAGLAGLLSLQSLAADGSAVAMHVSLLTGIGYVLGVRIAPHTLARVLGPVASLAAGSLLCLLLALALRRRCLTSAPREADGLNRGSA